MDGDLTAVLEGKIAPKVLLTAGFNRSRFLHHLMERKIPFANQPQASHQIRPALTITAVNKNRMLQKYLVVKNFKKLFKFAARRRITLFKIKGIMGDAPTFDLFFRFFRERL